VYRLSKFSHRGTERAEEGKPPFPFSFTRLTEKKAQGGKKKPAEATRAFARQSTGCNLGHPLCRLGESIEWASFDERFESMYCPDNGRHAIQTRMMVGLNYLKYMENLSDEEVVARWVENPYWQYFCGGEYFEHEIPCDPSSLSRWWAFLRPIFVWLKSVVQTNFYQRSARLSVSLS
jgi:IS5 family transposase